MSILYKNLNFDIVTYGVQGKHDYEYINIFLNNLSSTFIKFSILFFYHSFFLEAPTLTNIMDMFSNLF
jgi:hypothetical protein